MNNSLAALAYPKNHDNLLLAEAAAWLHDFWKCTDEHIEQKASDRTVKSDDYRTKHLALLEPHQITLLGEPPVSLRTLIGEYDQYKIDDINKPWLLRTLRRCHNVAHTEKETVYDLGKQTCADTRRSSPFGYESEPLTDLTNRLDSLPFSQISNRSEFRRCVGKAFSYACADTQRPINEVTLWDWSSIVAALYKSALAAAVLDNKVDPPTGLRWRLLSVRLNGAAFSERVARIPDLLVRQKLITDGLNRVRRLLEETYPLGTEVYRDEDGSVFIVPNIKNLLTLEDGQGENLSGRIVRKFNAGTINDQISLQLAGEVIPSLKLDEGEPWYREESHGHQDPLPIAKHVTDTASSPADPNLVNHWWHGHREDICTVCQLRPQGWEAAGNVAHYDRRARGKQCPSTCQTCKALERKVCDICEQRREDRSKEWAENELGTTIWLDEIADVNGRLGLVVGKFNLEHWLNGDMLFYPGLQKTRSRLVLRIKYLGSALTDGQTLLINGNTYTWHQALGVFISQNQIEMKQAPQRFREQNLLIDRPKGSPKEVLQEPITIKDIHKLSNGHYCIDLEKNISNVAVGGSFSIRKGSFRVADNSAQIETANDGAVKIVEDQILHPGHLMVEQYFRLPEIVPTQTPARLHRVWETTQKFWEEIKSNFRTSVGAVSPRLHIRATFIPESDADEALGDFHTYELKLGSINLSVVHVGGGEFLTVDNLERTAVLLNPSGQRPRDYSAAANEVRSQLQLENTIDRVFIEEPTGYGGPNKFLGKLRLAGAVILEQMAYIPAICILTEPGTFMAIVSANKALQLIQAIRKKYEKEIGKVRNRLPITVGVVFAGRRTPLPAILDAGRRILKQPTSGECWTITNIEPALPRSSWPDEVKLSLAKIKGAEEKSQPSDFGCEDTDSPSLMSGQSLPIKVQTLMGDKATHDEWFPYWRMKSPISDGWVHICDLQGGDVIHLMPSRFDFEFLDTAARRFEVSYDEHGKRRGSSRPARPYYLEQLDEFEKLWQMLSNGLATSQIHNLIGIIEAKRMEWSAEGDDKTFQIVARDALNNAYWKARPSQDDFERLEQAALSGQLADVVELHLQILKDPVKADEMGGNK